MGRAMAGTAHRNGIPTVVWNREPSVARRMAPQGVEVATSVTEAVEEASMVITMVTDTQAVTSIAIDFGMLEALPAGSVWAQMSTIGIGHVGHQFDRREAATRHPVPRCTGVRQQGSRRAREAHHLRIRVGAGATTADPIFAAIGQRTVWLGQVGMGSRMKLVNNTLLAFTAEGVANSLALAARLGVEVGGVLDAFEGGPLMSPWMAAKISRIEGGDYSPEFPLELALKDVNLALEQADPERFTVLASLAREWEQVVGQGLGDEDVTVVTRSLES